MVRVWYGTAPANSPREDLLVLQYDQACYNRGAPTKHATIFCELLTLRAPYITENMDFGGKT